MSPSVELLTQQLSDLKTQDSLTMLVKILFPGPYILRFNSARLSFVVVTGFLADTLDDSNARDLHHKL